MLHEPDERVHVPLLLKLPLPSVVQVIVPVVAPVTVAVQEVLPPYVTALGVQVTAVVVFWTPLTGQLSGSIVCAP